MKFHLETAEQNLISHYGPGVISVNGTEYENNVLITHDRVLENWFQGEPAELELTHFSSLLESAADERPEIVVLGTGASHIFPPFQLMAELKSEGLALEVMNTRAACRTYSVLVSEYRSVAAALIQIPST